MAKSAVELNGMLVEEIEELGKRMHQLTEEYETACKGGDAFEAHYVIGKLQSVIYSLKTTAVRCHEMNEPDIPRDRHWRLRELMARDITDNEFENRRIQELIFQELASLAQEAEKHGT